MRPDAVIAGLLHELGVPDAALSPIRAHAQAVARESDRLGLVAERDVDAVLRRHSADSLLFALARRPIAGETWLDVGSGAGFPGLVLGIAFPETRFVLWEPQARRAGFLELLVLTLGLSVGVLRERLTADAAPQADVVVARALEDPQRALPLLPRLVVDGGAALVAAGQATPLPVNAVRIDVSRPHVDSPGVLLMMPPTR